jgi:hypothetical protein
MLRRACGRDKAKPPGAAGDSCGLSTSVTFFQCCGSPLSCLESLRHDHNRGLRGARSEARPRVFRVAEKRNRLQPRSANNGWSANIESILAQFRGSWDPAVAAPIPGRPRWQHGGPLSPQAGCRSAMASSTRASRSYSASTAAHRLRCPPDTGSREEAILQSQCL